MLFSGITLQENVIPLQVSHAGNFNDKKGYDNQSTKINEMYEKSINKRKISI